MRMMRPFSVKQANLISSTVAETAPLYNGATSYALNAVVRSDAAGGTVEFKSLVASNVGNPLTDASKWLPLGPSNRWKALDGKITAQTVNNLSISYRIQIAGRVDGVSVLNADAASVRIMAEDAVDGLVFDKTVSLVSNYGITDIFAYLTEPLERIPDCFIGGLPVLYSNLIVTVTVASPTGQVKLGEAIPTLSRKIGGTQYGASIGFIDYSRKEKDTFGNDVVVERGFSKKAGFTINVATGMTDQVAALFAKYRATPIVYLGSELFGCTLVYGWARDFNEEIRGPRQTICSVQVEGLSQ